MDLRRSGGTAAAGKSDHLCSSVGGGESCLSDGGSGGCDGDGVLVGVQVVGEGGGGGGIKAVVIVALVVPRAMFHEAPAPFFLSGFLTRPVRASRRRRRMVLLLAAAEESPEKPHDVSLSTH